MFKKISLIAFVAVLFASCDISERNSSSCPIIIGVSTTEVTGPEETTVGVPITLEVSYKTKKNCGSFSSFFENPSTDPLVDIITTNTYYDQCNCDEIESVDKQNYTFKKSEAGVYTVKFRKTNETYVEHIVTVQ